jgi:DNA-binding NarL/FixJ family response regulator
MKTSKEGGASNIREERDTRGEEPHPLASGTSNPDVSAFDHDEVAHSADRVWKTLSPILDDPHAVLNEDAALEEEAHFWSDPMDERSSSPSRLRFPVAELVTPPNKNPSRAEVGSLGRIPAAEALSLREDQKQPVIILIVDEDPVARAGLKAILETTSDLRVTAEAPDARSAFAVLDARNPDVVIMNTSLPGLDGISASREMIRRSGRTKILMRSNRHSAAEVLEAFRAGATGFSLKAEPASSLVEAIRKVAQGQRYVSPSLAPISTMQAAAHLDSIDVLSPLSDREREIFHLLVQGLSNRAVSRELCISLKTVASHRQRIYEKLGLHSVTELVRFAANNYLLRESTPPDVEQESAQRGAVQAPLTSHAELKSSN